MSHKKAWQCLNNNCLQVFYKRVRECPSCKGKEIQKLSVPKCGKCGKEDEDIDNRTIYFGPNGNLCEDCVPRDMCYKCNWFSTKKEALKVYKEKNIKKIKKGQWIIVDDKGRLVPCVDYC